MTETSSSSNKSYFEVAEFTGDLVSLLDLKAPPFAGAAAFHQLRYISRYLTELGCRSVLIEPRYVDRDYMEDYSVFYSRSLIGYGNTCMRLHFFRSARETIEPKFAEILRESAEGADPERTLRRKSRSFSSEAYLGFCVIKPLRGSPVGRTVLLPYPLKTGDGSARHFDSTRLYRANIGPIELTVSGLAFQQQDVGVSACATTALWSSLHKAKDLEDVGPTTPAQITSLASRFSLPFGRSMPSEGLSVDQMCQAVRAFELAPHLLRPRVFNAARPLLYGAVRSGFAPILIIARGADPTTAHAITAVGVKVSPVPNPRFSAPNLWDYSQAMTALYIHDDRVGPYEKAVIQKEHDELHLVLDEPGSINGASPTDWVLTHILLPLHPKIRLSFSSLNKILTALVGVVGKINLESSIATETLILKGPDYLRGLAFRRDGQGLALRLAREIGLSRYVAILRFSIDEDVVDVLIDTTSTEKNLHFLGVASTTADSRLANELASICGCKVVTPPAPTRDGGDPGSANA